MNGTDATRWLVRIGVVVGGTFTLASGLFSALLPVSFYQAVATFSPYNQHLFHDVGVFQIGLGLTLLLTLVFTDALLAVLLGNPAAAGAPCLFSFPRSSPRGCSPP